WVLNEACRQMQAWRTMGAGPLFVSVNLSPVQFSRGNIEAVITHALQTTGLDPGQLELEVTESTLIVEIADKVRVKVGRGYVSSLAQTTKPTAPPAKEKEKPEAEKK
ncbi:MAG: EAL domain-containing protein, partial [Desulfobacteraceae bacterium]|nr:EAL domain-containing protein [Desulfobacteraceae bacterium]